MPPKPLPTFDPPKLRVGPYFQQLRETTSLPTFATDHDFYMFISLAAYNLGLSVPTLKPIQHGTLGGIKTHRNRNVAMCEPCKKLHRDYERTRARQAAQDPIH
jgi:hypothetical protein